MTLRPLACVSAILAAAGARVEINNVPDATNAAGSVTR